MSRPARVGDRLPAASGDGAAASGDGAAPAACALREAFDYAHDLELTLWDFAVEIQSLLADGLSKNDLRWLVCKGYVRHAGELTPRGSKHRAFRSIGRLNFCKRTCFVLTEEAPGSRCKSSGGRRVSAGPCAP